MFLPFEGQGAISTWRLQLPTQFKSFDYDTISDVILHMRYTALDGGALLKNKATSELQTTVNEFIQSEGQGLARIFSLRHEFPGEWHGFLNPLAGTDQKLTMALTRERFPFLFKDRNINIKTIELFVKIMPEFTRGYNESTVQLSLASDPTALTSDTGLRLALWNGLLHTSMDFTNLTLPGSVTLGAWVNDGHVDPLAIQDIFVVCHYICEPRS